MAWLQLICREVESVSKKIYLLFIIGTFRQTDKHIVIAAAFLYKKNSVLKAYEVQN